MTEQLDPTLSKQRVGIPVRSAASRAPSPGADRWWLVCGAIAAALIIAAFAAPWGSRMIDLEVYRVGASALLEGKDLYTVSEPASGLVFTYPVFAAVVFTPFAVVSTPVAQIAILTLSLVALWSIVHLTVLAVRSAVGAARGSALAWSVPLSVMAVAAHPVLETLLFGQINLILTALVLADVLPRDRGRARGVLVGIAAGIKLVPGIFIIYFLVTGQRRAAVTALLTIARDSRGRFPRPATRILGVLDQSCDGSRPHGRHRLRHEPVHPRHVGPSVARSASATRRHAHTGCDRRRLGTCAGAPACAAW